MKLHFLGASGNIVTGSCYLMEHESFKILIDCGMFQGSPEVEALNYEPFPFNPADIDYLFLTHAHLDHTGRIPKLVREGFRGKIISTNATRDLAEIVMMDSAKIQEEDARGGTRINYVHNKKPLYTREDMETVMKLFEVYPFGELVKLSREVSFRMREAGHILGSASFEVWFENDNGRERKIVFSGDIGQTGARIIRDPDFIRESDYVVIESTYGGRIHKDKSSTLLELLSILEQASKQKSKVLIPTFAVERTQELLYEMNLFVEKRLLKGLKFYLDSPMAVKATNVFKVYKEYYDQDAMELLRLGDDPFHFTGLNFIENVHESKRLAQERAAVIMAGSGMCTGGRILHHLANELHKKDTHVVFVGFQVPGTLGRRIVDRTDTVRIYGMDIPVRAQIHTLGGFSAHADQHDLLYWLRSYGHSPRNVFITHGDKENRETLSSKINQELQLQTVLPLHNEKVTLD